MEALWAVRQASQTCVVGEAAACGLPRASPCGRERAADATPGSCRPVQPDRRPLEAEAVRKHGPALLWKNNDPLDRAKIDLLDLANGQRTPEILVRLRFHTPSTRGCV